MQNLSERKLNQKTVNLEYAFNWGINLEHRIINITDDISTDVFSFLEAGLSELEGSGRKGIIIRINSYGGDVYDALGMVDRIKGSPRHITTEGYGKIMSAATAILACGDKRRMGKRARFMHHPAQIEGLSGELKDLTREVRNIEEEEHLWAEMMEEFSKEKAQYWLDLNNNGNTYLTAEKCLEKGVIDEIFG